MNDRKGKRESLRVLRPGAIRLIILVSSLLLAGLVGHSAGADERHDREAMDTVVLVVGEEVSLDYGPVTRVAISNPDTLDTRVDSSGHVLLKGLSSGEASVLIWLPDDSKVSVHVTVTDG